MSLISKQNLGLSKTVGWEDKYNMTGSGSLVNVALFAANGAEYAIAFNKGTSALTGAQVATLNYLPVNSLIIDGPGYHLYTHASATTWQSYSGSTI